MPSGRKALDFSRVPSKSPHKPIQTRLYSLSPPNMFRAPVNPQRGTQVSFRLWSKLAKFCQRAHVWWCLRMPHSQVQPPQGDGIFVWTIGGSKAQFGIGFVVMLKIFLGVRKGTSKKLQLGGETLCIQVNNISPPCLRKKINLMRYCVGVSI